MPMKHQIEEAVTIARGLLGGVTCLDSPAIAIVDLARRFSEIRFDIPDTPEADGYLFQYGTVNWFSEPTFVLGMVRQLEFMESFGECELSQIEFEFRYPLDDDLAAMGSYSCWWFPYGETGFEEWLTVVEKAPIMKTLSQKKAREFGIWQDRV